MLELDLLDDGDKATEKKHWQLLALEFGNVQITKYPPDCKTPEQRQQFDADVTAAAQSASKEIGREVPADSIGPAICGYACRAYALKEVMPAADEIAEKLRAVIKAYEQRNNGGLCGLLEQMTGAAGPLAEALERLELAGAKADRRIDMPRLIFLADMAGLYTGLTGNTAGKTADGDHGSPFARFSFEAAKLAGCASDTMPRWAETLKKLLPQVLGYLAAESEQLATYDQMIAADFIRKD